MAHRSHNLHAVPRGRVGTAVFAVLLLFVGRHYGYYLLDGADRSQLWNASGALVALVLLAAVVRAWPVVPVGLIVLWAAFEELQVLICSVLFIIQPWPMPENADQCSALLGVDLAAFGVLAITAILLRLPVNSYSSGNRP